VEITNNTGGTERRSSFSPNDFLNLIIVVGLIVIAIIGEVGALVMYYRLRVVQTELMIFASNIGAGLLGYLAREMKQAAPAGPTVQAETVTNVNQQPRGDDPKGQTPASIIVKEKEAGA